MRAGREARPLDRLEHRQQPLDGRIDGHRGELILWPIEPLLKRLRPAAAPVVLAAALAAAVPSAAVAQARPRLDVRLFAPFGPPGQPEPIAVGPDGLVYVATNQQDHGPFARRPSQVVAFTRAGVVRRRYVIRGQDLAEDHGIQGLAFDGSGLLHALDRSRRARVVVLDPRTGRRRDYATFRDVPRCAAAGRRTDCSATARDRPAEPDYLAFSPDGSAYVTDIEQALIWRIPRGGGRARVWFTDPRLEGAGDFGPNGIQFLRDRRTLLVANTFFDNSAVGALWTVRVRRGSRPGRLRVLWRSRPGDGPDGVAVARSGNIYVALASGNAVALVSPRGREVARSTARVARGRSGREVPVAGPGSLAFAGRRLLVTNHCPVGCDPPAWAVLDVWAGEPGLALHRPVVVPGGRAGVSRAYRPRT
jgi:sugar lactone lactonase YvrE